MEAKVDSIKDKKSTKKSKEFLKERLSAVAKQAVVNSDVAQDVQNDIILKKRGYKSCIIRYKFWTSKHKQSTKTK